MEYTLYRLLRTLQKLQDRLNRLPYTDIQKIKEYQSAIRRVRMHAEIYQQKCYCAHYFSYYEGGSAHETDAMREMSAN